MLIHKKWILKRPKSLLISFYICLLTCSPCFSFSTHFSTTSIERSFDKVQASIGDPITVTTTFKNFDTIDLRGLYYVDHIPQGLTVSSIIVKIDGNVVSDSIEEYGSIDEVYEGTIPYRWIMETPNTFNENNPIGPNSTLEIKYSVTSGQSGEFNLNAFNWVGFYLQKADEGQRAAFGHSSEFNDHISVSWIQNQNINLDNDSDGLPDHWEIDYGLDPNNPGDASQDLDNDGYTNIEEFNGATSPLNNSTHPIRPYIVESHCTPYADQGIQEGSLRVPVDTSIVIRIKGQVRIDTNSIDMMVQGEDISSCMRSKQVIEGDCTDYWVIFYPTDYFSFGENVTVTVDAKDIRGIPMQNYTYGFRTESEDEYLAAITNTPSFMVDDYSDPCQYVCSACSGTEIEGARIICDPNESVRPHFGPLGEIPPLTISHGVGLPVSLEPPTVFVSPVKIFIPCPGVADVSILDVFCFHPAIGWERAEDADGWMVPGTRINRNETSPPVIEIQVNYFSAVQAGLKSWDIGIAGSGCFINTSSPEPKMGQIIFSYRPINK
ncbi:MAG: hypothetical protein ACMUIM_08695 [bacterium]